MGHDALIFRNLPDVLGNFRWKVCWNFPLFIYRCHWPYVINADKIHKKKEDNYFFCDSMHAVYSHAFISLFFTTIIQLLLFTKHWVGVIVMSHSPIYWQTAAMHNKFMKISRNFPLILNFQKIFNPTYMWLLLSGLLKPALTTITYFSLVPVTTTYLQWKYLWGCFVFYWPPVYTTLLLPNL